MKSFVQATLLVIALAVTSQASHAQFFTGFLSGPAESPPNASPGTGIAYVTVDGALHTMRVQVTFSGLTAGVTASHIHSATAVAGTGTAGVATTTPTFTGFPSGVTSGSYDNTFNMTFASSYNPAFVTANGGTTASAEAALFAGILAGKSYLNIHTSNFPSGEIRGFLTQVAVPEPGMAVGLLGTVTAFGLHLRLRRRAKKA
jgi:hypothetical protein